METEDKKEVKQSSKILKLIFFIIIIICLCSAIYFFINKYILEPQNSNLNSSNSATQNLFSIEKIYLYSSASSTNNNTSNSSWNLNVHQFTDIAIYLGINNIIKEVNTSSNETVAITENNDSYTIKQLYIDNIKFNNFELGTPNLYFKSTKDFGIFSMIEENRINDRLDYELYNDSQDIDFTKPQNTTSLSIPLTLSFINSNIKENYVITDYSEPLVYDGSLLKRCKIPLYSLEGSLSFNINIINNLDEHFYETITLDIPLRDEQSSIYDGSYTKIYEAEDIPSVS